MPRDDWRIGAWDRVGRSPRSTRGGQLVFSVVLAWFFFHLLGQWLLTSTAEFHQAVLWKEQLLGGGSSDGDDR